jgi:hypothetical protein
MRQSPRERRRVRLLLYEFIEPRRGLAQLARAGFTRLVGHHAGGDLLRLDLGQLPLDHGPELGEIGAALFHESVELCFDLPDRGPRFVDDPLALGARLTEDELRLAVGLLADLAAELLCRDER